MKYLVTYDLISPGQEYSDLYQAIRDFGEAKHGMQNTWFLKSESSATKIRDGLKVYVDKNDKIFVCAIGNWASFNIGEVPG